MSYQSKYVESNPCVYLMSVGNYLKIGKSYGDASTRLAGFRQCCPLPVSLVAIIPGDKKLEVRLHREFEAYRVRKNEDRGGEWYYYHPDIVRAFGIEPSRL